MKQAKYHLTCVECGAVTPDFKTWFDQNQMCQKCGSKHSEVWYDRDYRLFPQLTENNSDSFWQYFNYLPLYHQENIVTRKEGGIPLQRWDFLDTFAKETYGLNINVLVYRNDLNGGTGTFKDVAASLAASLFKEQGINQYCIASTGNTATAYATYLSIAGINCSVFIPENASKTTEAFISACGQQVFRVKGDYAKTKEIAGVYSKKNHILSSTGNIDPIRVEAKKTMVFEWLRQFGKMPDVYIQAVSGGTAPIAIDKGVRELVPTHPTLKNPRFILAQPDKCDPMVQAWEKAEKTGFLEGYEKKYPIIDYPDTMVSVLATGNPTSYPILAKLVKNSDGTFIRVNENKLVDVAKLISFENNVMIGPASAVCIAGYFESLRKGLVKDGETVLLNIGEGVRSTPEFVEQMIYTSKDVDDAGQCNPHLIQSYWKQLWDAVVK